MKKKSELKKGFSLIEVILATAIFSVFTVAAIMVMIGSQKSSLQAEQMDFATAYATEGIEAVRSIRNDSFDRLSDAQSSGLLFSNDSWEFDGEYNESGIFRRIIVVEKARRDGDGNITLDENDQEDENMKRIVSTVNWEASSGGNVSVEFVAYLSRWK
jgi:prepilin-type N-terminal cleavage/methylation domain-containing protein